MTTSPILTFHVIAGAIGLLSGATALVFRKGSRPHRVAGNVFFVSMLCMAASGAYRAHSQSSVLPVLVGILTSYLVATAWATVKRKGLKPGFFEYGALLVALAVGGSGITIGLEALNGETGSMGDFIAKQYLFFGSVALFAATLDLRMIFRGGVSGAQRIARHLWRMSFALYIAASSFFLGQAQVFPDAVREAQVFSVSVLALPKYVVLVLMIFWLSRTLVPNWYKKAKYILNRPSQFFPPAVK